MPRFYRNQFTPWQPSKQVFQVVPADLSTINSMVIVTERKPSTEAQSTLETGSAMIANLSIARNCKEEW